MSRMTRYILWTTAALALTSATVTASAQNQLSVAEAAKKKASDKKAKRVFTNEDIPERAPDAVSAQSGAGASGNSGSNATAATAAVPKPGETKPGTTASAPAASDPKNAKLTELQEKLDTYKREEQELKDKLAKMEEKANNEPDENHKRMYREMLEHQQTTLSEYRQKQEQVQQQIEDEKAKSKSK